MNIADIGRAGGNFNATKSPGDGRLVLEQSLQIRCAVPAEIEFIQGVVLSGPCACSWRSRREAEHAALVFPLQEGVRPQTFDRQISWGGAVEDVFNDVWSE